MTTTQAPAPVSIPGLLVERTTATPSSLAFKYRSGDGWTSLTWSQTTEQVRNLAAGLIGLGVEAETRVAILAGTR